LLVSTSAIDCLERLVSGPVMCRMGHYTLHTHLLAKVFLAHPVVTIQNCPVDQVPGILMRPFDGLLFSWGLKYCRCFLFQNGRKATDARLAVLQNRTTSSEFVSWRLVHDMKKDTIGFITCPSLPRWQLFTCKCFHRTVFVVDVVIGLLVWPRSWTVLSEVFSIISTVLLACWAVLVQLMHLVSELCR